MLKNLINLLARKHDPIKYWRRLGVKIGTDCEVYSSASFGSEPYLISIGNHVRVNHNVMFVTHDGGAWVIRGLYLNYKESDLFGRISIGNNVHIGTSAIIMPGVKVGDNCIIGCGAIVTRDIPENSVAVGVPARVIESIDDYFRKHKNDFVITKKLDLAKKREYLYQKFNLK